MVAKFWREEDSKAENSCLLNEEKDAVRGVFLYIRDYKNLIDCISLYGILEARRVLWVRLLV